MPQIHYGEFSNGNKINNNLILNVVGFIIQNVGISKKLHYFLSEYFNVYIKSTTRIKE